MSPPRILGNGSHDDTEGLEAALAGNPVAAPHGMLETKPGCVTIVGARLRITRAPTFPANTAAVFRDCRLVLEGADFFGNVGPNARITFESK